MLQDVGVPSRFLPFARPLSRARVPTSGPHQSPGARRGDVAFLFLFPKRLSFLFIRESRALAALSESPLTHREKVSHTERKSRTHRESLSHTERKSHTQRKSRTQREKVSPTQRKSLPHSESFSYTEKVSLTRRKSLTQRKSCSLASVLI